MQPRRRIATNRKRESIPSNIPYISNWRTVDKHLAEEPELTALNNYPKTQEYALYAHQFLDKAQARRRLQDVCDLRDPGKLVALFSALGGTYVFTISTLLSPEKFQPLSCRAM